MERSWSTDADPIAEPWRAPRLTADLPGSGGVLLSDPEDFRVDESLPYPLQGSGSHTFVHIEKRGIDTLAVVRRLVDAVGVASDDVGAAGLKDRWAIARQWLSVPDEPPATDLEARLSKLESDEITVLEITRHPHKLRRGHVRSNRFIIRLRHVPSEGLERARVTIDALKARGVPNAFGRQRFGREGLNAVRGLELLRKPRTGRSRLSSLLLSSVQSAVFNRVLALRLHDGRLQTALLGDLMQKHETGGLFEVTDPDTDQARMQRLEISPTGPIVGKRMRTPSGWSSERESEAFVACRLQESDRPRFGRGTRRPLRIPCDPTASVIAPEEGVLEISFALPSGSYATTILDEIVKPEGGMFERQLPDPSGAPSSADATD